MIELNVLVVDDDVDALDALRRGIQGPPFRIFTSNTYRGAIHHLKSQEIDIVITDLKLKDGSGLDILSYISEFSGPTAVIIITAYGSIESAVDAIRRGAYEYLVKPFRIAELKRLLNRLSETVILRRENEQLRQRLVLESGTFPLVGISSKFKNVIEMARQIAGSKSTILITGETGTGKELIASLIHSCSPRSDKALVKINCGAIPENLLEAELFGYERGAFTGALKQKRGKIEQANQGTLFLDEIGDLMPALQVKLLRFLQDGEFERLGGVETLKLDVRVIAATNADLNFKMEQGTFREDLFFRLNVISLHIPPLRERPEDISFLVQHFIEKYNSINDKKIEGVNPLVINRMMAHPWRGNIRELENMVERAVVLSQESILQEHHFPGLVNGSEDSPMNIGARVGMTASEIEQLAIEKTLQYCLDDKQKAARILQIGMATLYRKIKEYGIDPPQ